MLNIIAAATSVSAAPFTPTSITGCKLWLDASDTSSISVSGSDVTQWNDKSGNGYNFTQGTSANRPSSGTRTINSLNVIDFDGTNDSLTTSAAKSAFNFLHSAASTIFIVLQQDTVNNIKVIFSTGIQPYSSGDIGFFLYSNAPADYQMGVSNASTYVSRINANFNETVARYDTIKSDPTNGTAGNRLKYSKSGAAFAGSNSDTGTVTTSNSTNDLTLANATNGGFAPMNGCIGEVIIYDSVLSDTNITTVQNYLDTKWAI